GVPRDAMDRLAAEASRMASQTGQPAPSTEELLKLRAPEFVQMLQRWQLGFVQHPDYVAGFSGRWDDERALRVHLYPLIQQRAEVNPNNWDVTKVPAVDFHDREAVDLGKAITDLGSFIWGSLRELSETLLREALNKTIKDFGVPSKVLDDVAAGINGATQHPVFGPGQLQGQAASLLQLDAATLSELTPTSFVELLVDYRVGFDFKQSPGVIAELGLRWVREGFQPW